MRVRKAVFPVAGLGIRFLPATKCVPKEMLPVVDKPLIQYAVEEAKAAGIEQFILVNRLGKGMLEDYFDHAPDLEATLRAKGSDEMLEVVLNTKAATGAVVATRQMEYLGLGHAVWCARELVGDEPFAVILPDDLLLARKPVLQQMVEVFAKVQDPLAAVMAVARDQTRKYGVLDLAKEDAGDWEDGGPIGGIVRPRGLVEKPAPADAPSRLAIIGRYILTPDIFPLLENQERGAGGEIQLTDALVTLLAHRPFFGYRFEGERFDCGDKAGYQMANLAFAMEIPNLRARIAPFIAERASHWGVGR
ncbi:MAG: UTP--glucose-1-phosphate uridylyltransferase [Magnetococcales bacterium]|nr:UTP--glucose-1-phosphate uridylyltransferase [Magnetococcales bacterium]MBF0157430.1 UTP--glucose-1-phosphate uridylyltransferase [Magnetococcales bacterium]